MREPSGQTNGTAIEPRICTVRGQRVILDVDLARIYGVKTGRLNEQVSRNRARFPPDFMFRLQSDEKNKLIADCDILRNLKYSRVLPRAFTEHGALMVASVLNSMRAVEMSIFVVRAFVRFREMLSRKEEFAERLTELESKIAQHDKSIQRMVTALRELLREDRPIGLRAIGFQVHRRDPEDQTGGDEED